LGSGERAAISCAVELNASAIILDDETARKIAAELKIPVIGTGGVLILAKERQLIAAVKPCLEAWISHRFFLARWCMNQFSVPPAKFEAMGLRRMNAG